MSTAWKVVLSLVGALSLTAIIKLFYDFYTHKPKAVLKADLDDAITPVIAALPVDPSIKKIIQDALDTVLKPTAKLLLFLLPLGLILAASPARAQTVSSGPTIPVVRLDLGSGAPPPFVLGAGAGYQVGVSLVPRVLGGKVWDLLGLDVAAFAGHAVGGAVISAAVLACTLSQLVCLGGGYDLYSSSGKRWPFVLGVLSFNLGLADTTAPPMSQPALQHLNPRTLPAPSSPPPANTIEF